MGARLSNSVQYYLGNMSLEKQIALPEQFKDIVIGIVGTGMMATAHAARWSTSYQLLPQKKKKREKWFVK